MRFLTKLSIAKSYIEGAESNKEGGVCVGWEGNVPPAFAHPVFAPNQNEHWFYSPSLKQLRKFEIPKLKNLGCIYEK